MSTARDRIFARLRAAESASAASADELCAGAPAPHVSSCPAVDEDLAARFAAELERVGGEVLDCAPGAAGDALTAWFAALAESPSRVSGRVAIDADPFWDGAPVALRECAAAAGFEVEVVSGDDSTARLVDADLGVTFADRAIAETGTIVQCARPFRPRGLSLVPPHHLVLLPQERLVASFDDLFSACTDEEADADFAASCAAYFTWITGPSRTADIEKVLTIGVHGPGRLTVVLLRTDSDG